MTVFFFNNSHNPFESLDPKPHPFYWYMWTFIQHFIICFEFSRERSNFFHGTIGIKSEILLYTISEITVSRIIHVIFFLNCDESSLFTNLSFFQFFRHNYHSLTENHQQHSKNHLISDKAFLLEKDSVPLRCHIHNKAQESTWIHCLPFLSFLPATQRRLPYQCLISLVLKECTMLLMPW